MNNSSNKMNRGLIVFLDFLEVAYTVAAVEFSLIWFVANRARRMAARVDASVCHRQRTRRVERAGNFELAQVGRVWVDCRLGRHGVGVSSLRLSGLALADCRDDRRRRIRDPHPPYMETVDLERIAVLLTAKKI